MKDNTEENVAQHEAHGAWIDYQREANDLEVRRKNLRQWVQDAKDFGGDVDPEGRVLEAIREHLLLARNRYLEGLEKLSVSRRTYETALLRWQKLKSP